MTTPAQEALVKSTVGKILMSESCQKIDFRRADFRITGSGYAAVALTLNAPPSKPRRLRVVVGGLPPGQAANYDGDNNLLRVPNAAYGTAVPFEVSSIVHEATHVLMDLSLPGKHTPGLTEEMLAYVAGTLFNLHEMDADRPIWKPKPGGIFDLAQTAAMGVMNTPGATLSQHAAENVMNAIKNDSVYNFLKTSPNYRQSGVPF